MRMRLYMKRRTKRRILMICLSVLILIITAVTAYFVTREIMYKQVENERHALEIELADKQREVYVSKTEIRAGEIISGSNVELIKTYTSMPQEQFITEEDIGKYSVYDIPNGTHVLRCMVCDSISDSMVREVECSEIILSSNLSDNDCVDVRLYMPDGTNYVVISKKNIHLNINPEEAKLNTCYFHLTENEIINLSSAVTDMQNADGAMLYTTKYVEPAFQKASEVTYRPGLIRVESVDRLFDAPEISEEVSEKEQNMEEILWRP